MSKVLAHLLNQPEPMVQKAINTLEDLSGYRSEDVRLIAEVRQKTRHKHSQLALDPGDTTAAELYHALLARFERDSRFFSGALGLDKFASADNFSEHLAGLVERVMPIGEILALKRPVAKQLLRKKPPRRLMKKLNCRSIDSMLKRYNISEIYGVLSAIESDHWLKNFMHLLCDLTASDFEKRPLKLITPSYERYGEGKGVTAMPLMGIVVIWPTNYLTSQVILSHCLAVVETISKLQVYNFFLKHQLLSKNFGRILFKLLTQGLSPAAIVAGLPVSWQTLQRHFREHGNQNHPIFLESNLENGDLESYLTIDTMAKLNPDLKWWGSNSHLAASIKGSPISFHLLDVINNYFHSKPYTKSSSVHFRKNLWHELLSRYLNYEGVQNYILPQLGDKRLVPEEAQTESTLLSHPQSFRLPVRS